MSGLYEDQQMEKLFSSNYEFNKKLNSDIKRHKRYLARESRDDEVAQSDV